MEEDKEGVLDSADRTGAVVRRESLVEDVRGFMVDLDNIGEPKSPPEAPSSPAEFKGRGDPSNSKLP